MRVLLDAGAFIGVDRDEDRTMKLLALARRANAELVTTAPVVAQAWRNGSRQANVARLLRSVDVREVCVDDAKDAGELLAKTNGSDVVDAFLVLLAFGADHVFTSDPTDIGDLLTARGVRATIVRV